MVLDFSPVDLTMKSRVEHFTRPYGLNSSEYSFTNILMWGTNGRISVAERDGAMFFLLSESETPYMFAPLLENGGVGGDYSHALEIAKEYFVSIGVEPCFRAISGRIYEQFAACEGFSLAEDRDNFDYVYSMEELLNLTGKKLHAKRNHINQFKANYQFEYVELDESMLDECVAVYCDWLDEKDRNEPYILSELCAIKTAISNMRALGLRGGGIRVDGRLVAYSIGQMLNNDYALIHIEKAETSMIGLFSVINQQFIEHEFQDAKFINREEDMGIEGLRRAKMSYNPVELIKKYEGRLAK